MGISHNSLGTYPKEGNAQDSYLFYGGTIRLGRLSGTSLGIDTRLPFRNIL